MTEGIRERRESMTGGEEMITKDMVINDVVKMYPETLAIFSKFKVDSCCGGGQSIENTACADAVNVEALVRALNESLGDRILKGGK